MSKLKAYTNMDTGNPAYKLWKAARIFDPRQVPSLSKNIADFAPHQGLNANYAKILEEWAIYINEATSTPLADDFSVTQGDCRNLPSVAIPVVMMLMTSVDAERNFSKTGQVLTP